MITSTIQIPVIDHGDWDSQKGLLRKTITHDVPFAVGTFLEDRHLSDITVRGQSPVPIVEKVVFDVETNQYLIFTSTLEIQSKFLDKGKWQWVPSTSA